MEKSLKGTKTLENLMKAFAGESQARNRYTMFAAQASKDGHQIIAEVFNQTAENERIHAKEFYKHIVKSLGENEPIAVDINATYPAVLGDTLTNLKEAAEGEHEEFAVLYSAFADVAEQEGFPAIAFTFRKIGDIEKEHEDRYRAYAKRLEEGTLYSRDEEVEWLCTKCGHIHRGTSAVKVCPVCAHPQGYFEVRKVNF